MHTTLKTGLGALALSGITMLTATATAGDCSSNNTNTMIAAYGKKADIVTTAVEAGSFNTLAAALEAAGLVGALQGDGPFTVFAPTDEAFAKLPKGTVENLLKPGNKQLLTSILTYHVVSGDVRAKDVIKLDNAATLNGQRAGIEVKGGNVFVAGKQVVSTDIECSNGVIHVIDEVMMPQTDNIPQVAGSAGTFTTLLAALGAADLEGALMGDGPFTVFAPTDAAFAKLPAGTVESLLEPENLDTLKSILLAHVVEGRVYADQVVGLSEVTTLGGAELDVLTKKGTVKIAGSKVSAVDIETANGVIHVIDAVIIPSS